MAIWHGTARAWYGCTYAIWLYGYMAIWLWHGLDVYEYMAGSGYMIILLDGYYVAIWLWHDLAVYSYMGLWVYGSCMVWLYLYHMAIHTAHPVLHF